jgi:hypothetical protein
LIETVRLGSNADLTGQGISIGKARLLSGMHADRGALAGSFALTLPDRYYGRVCGRIDIEAVIAGLAHGEGLIRSVDFVDFSTIEFADVHFQRALVQLHLHGIIGDVGQSQTGFRADAQKAGAEIQFGARILISPDVVADSQRAVHRAFDPIAGTLRLNGDRSGHIFQARDTARRIDLLSCGRSCRLICGRRRRLGRRVGR